MESQPDDNFQALRIADPLQGFRFLVTFLIKGKIPNPIDIHFKSVSGISANIKTKSVEEGAQNRTGFKLPDSINYPDLVLERGLLIGSPLHWQFIRAMTTLDVIPSTIIVSILNEKSIPIANWMFLNAFPVEWSISGIEATSSDVVIEKMVMTYSRFRALVL